MKKLTLIFAAAYLGAFGQVGFSTQAIDRSVEPCTNFYQFACGTWMKNNAIPSDQSRWGRFNELSERNSNILKDILETAAAKTGTRPVLDQKIGDYYSSCMDEKAIEARGTAPLQPELERIETLKNKKDMAEEVARLQKMGADVFFALGAAPDYKNSKLVIPQAGEGGQSLPDRDYYLSADPRSVEIRDKFLSHVTRMFELLGYEKERAASSAKAVLALETELAQASMDRVARRNPNNRYHPMSLWEFAALAPSFDWMKYARTLDAPHANKLNVANPAFFKSLETTLGKTSLDGIKSYLTWHFLHVSAPLLSQAFVKEDFDFFRRTLTGAKELRPRWKRCVEAVDADLPEALGRKYVEQAFGADAKSRMAELIANLTKALEGNINTLEWMTPPTRKRALEKLAAIQNKVGHPEKWIDYGKLEIKAGDALGNSLRSNMFTYARRLERVGKAPDPTEWRMSTPTVNAYYSSLENNINFPAGILQPPFFDVKLDDAVNYGGIGAVIGHEITHGFDDAGRRFDAQGNLNDWWTAEDAKEYERRAACIDQQYSGYEAVKGLTVNGKLTLGENVADNGGLRIAYLALTEALEGKSRKEVDGFTPEQRFFLGFAQVWCQNITEEGARNRILTDPHSPGMYRTNGTVSNMPEFWKAFGCKEGQPMMRGENACRVW